MPRARPRERGRSRSRIRATVLAVSLALGGVRLVSAQDSAASEYQVKAAFLFHFAQFVEWPPETLKDTDSPMTYCTIGDDPFHGALEQSLSGKTVRARPLRVQHLTELQEIGGCQVLFIGAVGKKRLNEALESASGSPILTVGETEHFAKDGGIIGIFLEQDKIRFEINLDAAGRAKLKFSAKLLALAKTVIGNPRGN